MITLAQSVLTVLSATSAKTVDQITDAVNHGGATSFTRKQVADSLRGLTLKGKALSPIKGRFALSGSVDDNAFRHGTKVAATAQDTVEQVPMSTAMVAAEETVPVPVGVVQAAIKAMKAARPAKAPKAEKAPRVKGAKKFKVRLSVEMMQALLTVLGDVSETSLADGEARTAIRHALGLANARLAKPAIQA